MDTEGLFWEHSWERAELCLGHCCSGQSTCPDQQGKLQALPGSTFSFSPPLALTLVPEWRLRRLCGGWSLMPLPVGVGGDGILCAVLARVQRSLQSHTSAGLHQSSLWRANVVSLAKWFVKAQQMVVGILGWCPVLGSLPVTVGLCLSYGM